MRSLLPFVSRTLATWDLDGPRWRAEEATLAFVDLSGFTRLSERLSRTIKGGAEELNAAISTMWQHLITVVHDFDGDVLQFGGDALLILFTGPDHTLRGALCLWDLQRTIRREGRIETEAGPVRLRMSAGLHTDTFHLFVAGEPHRELFVVGPALSTTCALESAAEAGQVLVSDRVVEALGASGLRPVGDGAHRMMRRPSGVATSVANREVLGSAERRLPAAVEEWVAAGATVGEHRLVSVAFVKAGGLDHVLVEDGPDAVLAVLDEISARVGAAVERYDITWLAADVGADGAKWLLVSGAPIAHEDDEDRLLQALCDIGAPDGWEHVQLGAARGKAFAAEVGHTGRRCYAVLGDVTNLAARLQARGHPGAVLAAAELIDAAGAAYRAEPLDPFPVKGKRALIHAREVAGVDATTERRHEDVALVGRGRELDSIIELLDRTRTGANGGAIEFVGAAGVGKTRMARVATSQARDRSIPVVAGRRDPYGAATPYWCLAPALRLALGIEEGASDAEVEGRLGSLSTKVTGPTRELGQALVHLALGALQTRRDSGTVAASSTNDDTSLLERRSVAVIGLLRAACKERGPVVIVAEDRHSYDDASRALLARLAASADQQPWIVIATCRPGSEALPGVPMWELEPLEPESARVMSIAVAGERPIRDDTIDWIVERSSGLPLAIREFTESLAGRVDRSPSDLPDSLDRLIAADIDRLPPRLRLLVRELAVIGFHADLDIVGHIIDGAAELRGPELARISPFCGLVDGRVVFRDELVRSAAYSGLSNRRKRILHARVAAVYRDRNDADDGLIGLHYARAGDHRRALEHTSAAARQADAAGAYVDASELYERALDSAMRLGDRQLIVGAIADRLGELHLLSGRLDRSAACFRVASVVAPGPPLGQAARLRKLARGKSIAGSYRSALVDLGRAERLLADVPEPERSVEVSELHRVRSQLRFWQSRFREALREGERALEAAERAGDPRSVAGAHTSLEMACAELGLERRSHHGEEALRGWEAVGDDQGIAHALLNLGVSEYAEGRWAETLRRYERAMELYRRVGIVPGEAWTINNIAEIRAEQGYLDEAATRLLTARRLFRAVGSALGIAFTSSGLGRLAGRRGAWDDASAHLHAAETEFRALGAASLVADTAVRWMELAVFRSAPDLAVRRAEELPALVAEDPMLRAWSTRLEAIARFHLGETERAHALLRSAVHGARASRVLAEVALGLDALVQFGFGDEAAVRERDDLLQRLGIVAVPEVRPRSTQSGGRDVTVR